MHLTPAHAARKPRNSAQRAQRRTDEIPAKVSDNHAGVRSKEVKSMLRNLALFDVWRKPLCMALALSSVLSVRAVAQTQNANTQSTQPALPQSVTLARLVMTPDGLHKAALLNNGRYVYTDDLHSYVRA